jgi:hypothetical protein
MNPSHVPEEVPGLEGPDYVTLVIEWGGNNDDAVTTVSASAPDRGSPDRGSMMNRKVATFVGALSAIALATWGLRRLRAVS